MAIPRSKSLFTEARFLVYRAIALAESSGVSLREIAYRSDLSVGSVQAALRSLRRLKTVRTAVKGNRVLYYPNKASADAKLFEVLFAHSESESIETAARLDQDSLLPLLASVAELHAFGVKVKRLNP